MTFNELNLIEPILRALGEEGYTTPTPIQQQAIPQVLTGRDVMGAAYPELIEQADTVDMWLSNEEESFNRTLEQGMRLLDDVVARARDAGEDPPAM